MTTQLPENAAAQTTKGAAGDSTLARAASPSEHASRCMQEPPWQKPEDNYLGSRASPEELPLTSREPDLPKRRTPPQPEEWKRRTRAGRKEANVRTRW